MTRYLAITIWQLRSYFCGAPSLTRGWGLSFVYAAGSSQHSLSRVRVPWYSRPYFTVSDLRLPISSPLTTRRVTVEVCDPASTRVSFSGRSVLSYNSLARTPRKIRVTCYQEFVFIGSLPSNGLHLQNIAKKYQINEQISSRFFTVSYHVKQSMYVFFPSVMQPTFLFLTFTHLIHYTTCFGLHGHP
jgi:hypothetical protein